MSIIDRRETYQPFEYQKAMDYWEKQQLAHWLHTEISMAKDLQDWEMNRVTSAEKNVVGNILKGFTQTEVVVNDYWARRVTKWFPKPEINSMASSFANMESIHARAYAYLNDTLGLDDYEAFMHEPTTAAKIDNLVDCKGETIRDKALSLAVFSGFAEGVQLFSSFAILLNFSRFNKLKGLGEIVTFSVKDESLHSEAGCWLFRTMMKEYPDLWDAEMKKGIYDAARTTVKLEDDFIDKAFELGDIEGLKAKDLKAYIRMRTNTKLNDLGLKNNWKNIDMDSANEVATWFDKMTVGIQSQDFFAGRVTDYSKSTQNWEEMFDD